MKWAIPFRGVFDRQPLYGIPYDAEDPFIFHTLNTLPDSSFIPELVKKGSVLVSKDEGRRSPEKNWAVNPDAIGEVGELDELAGDGKYVFLTPGYEYRMGRPTLAFRQSVLFALGVCRFRFSDMMAVYAEFEKLNPEIKPDKLKTGLLDLAERATLTPEESQWFTKEYVKTIVGHQGNFSQRAVDLMYFYKAKNARKGPAHKMTSEAIGELIQQRTVRTEFLSTVSIPISAAEMYYDMDTQSWTPMSNVTGKTLNGLSAMLMPKRNRSIIPGWKQR